MDYLELTVRIEPGAAPGTFTVRASSEVAGQSKGVLELPFGLTALLGVVHGIHPTLPVAGDVDPALNAAAPPQASPTPPPPATQEVAKQLGRKLFDALFKDDVRSALESTRDAALSRPNTGVRIRISVDLTDDRVREAAALPWELMWRDLAPLSTDPATPIVRFVDAQEPVRPLPLDGPLRILAVKSNPEGTGKLDLDAEYEAVTACWRELPNVQFDEVAPQMPAILAAMRAKRPHVVHYMGHGGFDSQGGFLELTDANGGKAPISGDRFAALIAQGQRQLLLVFLNACQSARTPDSGDMSPFTSVADALIRSGVPAVVGNQFSVEDDMAIAFSQAFYQSIAEGLAVDEAVACARQLLFANEDMPLFWATPVLFMRSPDGNLFARQDAPATAAASAPPQAAPPQPEPVRAMSEPSNRSINISGGTNTGVSAVTGDNNTVTTTVTTNTGPLPPPPSTAEMTQLMQQLQALVAQIGDEDQKARASRALDNVKAEVTSASPDKDGAATDLAKAIKIMKSSESLGSKAVELTPLVAKAAAWFAPAVAAPLFKALTGG